MSALLNGSPLNGRAPYVWAEGQSAASCESTAELLRAAYTASADHTAEAVSLTTAERFARPGESAAIAEAALLLTSTRFAYVYPTAVGESPSVAVAERTAWMADTSAVAESTPVVTPVRWRLAVGESAGEAVSNDDDDLVAVYRVTSVRDTRGISHTSINERSISRLHVNQVQFRGTCIARARSNGLANTQIAFGTGIAESVNTDDNLLVNVRRSMRGKAIAVSSATVDPYQIHVGNSIPAGDAHMYIAPDILRADGSNERYAWANPVAQTVFNQVGALAIRIAIPDDTVGVSSTIVADSFFTRDAVGTTTGESSSATADDGTRINHWQWVRGKTTASASTSAWGDRLAWVGAFGAGFGLAESSCEAIRYTWEWTESPPSISESESVAEAWATRPVSGDSAALAESEADAGRFTKTSASVIGESQSSIAAVVYHWTWVASSTTAGEALSTKADFLRRIDAVPVKPVYAEAFAPRVYFRLNAGESAPARRTIILAARERLLAVPASSRELTVR